MKVALFEEYMGITMMPILQPVSLIVTKRALNDEEEEEEIEIDDKINNLESLE